MYSMSFLIFTEFINKGAIQRKVIIRPSQTTTFQAEEDLSLYIIDPAVAFESTTGGAACIELSIGCVLLNTFVPTHPN